MLLPVEVCLVLAPDVNLFLNSCNQGCLHWCSLLFFLFCISLEQEGDHCVRTL